jgi:hypothetical protein
MEYGSSLTCRIGVQSATAFPCHSPSSASIDSLMKVHREPGVHQVCPLLSVIRTDA